MRVARERSARGLFAPRELHPGPHGSGQTARGGRVIRDCQLAARSGTVRSTQPQERRTVRIIVGVDPSEAATTACRFVAGREWPWHARVLLVGVRDEGIGGQRMTDDGLEQLLDDRAAMLRGRGLVVETVAAHGDPAPVLVRHASEVFADLLVVGNRGLGPLAGALLGSVSAALVDHAPCPVLVVRAESASRMLLATDGTESSCSIPRVLAAWGNAFRGLPVQVVSVAPRHAFVTPWSFVDDAIEEGADPELVFHEAVAHGVAEELVDLGWKAAALARCGEPSTEILGAGQEWGADVIVTGSRGLGTLQRLARGSVAHRVLTHARSSVLVVRGMVPATSAPWTPVLAASEFN